MSVCRTRQRGGGEGGVGGGCGRQARGNAASRCTSTAPRSCCVVLASGWVGERALAAGLPALISRATAKQMGAHGPHAGSEQATRRPMRSHLQHNARCRCRVHRSAPLQLAACLHAGSEGSNSLLTCKRAVGSAALPTLHCRQQKQPLAKCARVHRTPMLPKFAGPGPGQSRHYGPR